MLKNSKEIPNILLDEVLEAIRKSVYFKKKCVSLIVDIKYRKFSKKLKSTLKSNGFKKISILDLEKQKISHINFHF